MDTAGSMTIAKLHQEELRREAAQWRMARMANQNERGKLVLEPVFGGPERRLAAGLVALLLTLAYAANVFAAQAMS